MRGKIIKVILFLSLSLSVLGSERSDLKAINELYKVKDYDGAIKGLEEFMVTYPDSRKTKEIQIRLGKTYLLKGNYGKSKEHFDGALSDKKIDKDEKNDVLLYQVENTSKLKDLDSARVYLKNITDQEKYDKGLFLLGVGYYENGNYLNSKTIFDKIVQKNDEYYDRGVLYLSLSLYQNEEYIKSKLYMEAFLKGATDPKEIAMGKYILGSTEAKLGEDEAAKKLLEEVATTYPKEDYGIKSNLSLLPLYMKVGDTEKLNQSYNLLKGTPYEVEGNKFYADYLLKRGYYSDAVKVYSGIPKDEQDDATIFGYGYSLYKSGDKVKAKEILTPLKTSKDYKDRGYYYIAIINYEQGRYNDVLKDRKTLNMISLDPVERGNIQRIIGDASYKTGDYQTAYTIFKSLYDTSAGKKDLYSLIVVSSKMEDLSNLERYYNVYKGRFPNDLEYKRNVYLATGIGYSKAGLGDKGIEVYKEYLNDNVDETISDNLVALLLEKRRYAEMEEYLKKGESNDNTLYLLGIATLGNGDYKSATNYFGKVINGQGSEELKEKASYGLVKTFSTASEKSATVIVADRYIDAGYTNYTEEVLDMKGLAYFRMGEYSNSRGVYENLLTSEKYKEYATFQIADSYYEEGNYEEAIGKYKEVYTKYPDSKYGNDAKYWEIKSLVAAGKKVEASEAIDTLLGSSISNEYKDTLLAINEDLYSSSEDVGKKVEALEKSYENLSNESEKEEALKELLDIYYKQGNLAKVKTMTPNLKDPTDKNYWEGKTLEKEGKGEEAKVKYEGLLTSENYKDEANYFLGEYYSSKGDEGNALKYYETLYNGSDNLYKEESTYKLGTIYEKLGKEKEAFTKYDEVANTFKGGSHGEEAAIKSAILSERVEGEDPISRYQGFVNTYEKSRYEEYAYERITALYLKKGNLEEARKYYKVLSDIAPERAKKYEEDILGNEMEIN